MATSYAAPLSATEVGSVFVSHYYLSLQKQPGTTHLFYSDASSVIRVDGDLSESASAPGQIHTLIMSRIFTNVHIKTISSLESWNGGVQLVVSGSVKSTDFTGWRKFVQSFFLAPQEKGYFVLTDILNLIGDEVIDQSPDMNHSDDIVGSHPNISVPVEEEPVASDYPLEEEAREYVESVHIEADNPVEEYKFQEEQRAPEPEYEAEEETHLEEPVDSRPLISEAAKEPRLPVVEEPAAEPQKFTYASILRANNGKPAPPVIVQRPTKRKMPASVPHVQQSIPAEPVTRNFPSNTGADGVLSESGETKSVYVKNLPPTVTTLDLLQEFKNFGTIKKDGVFLIHKKETGVCFAFVEFEDAQSVGNAVKASPIEVAGNRVYIEERRSTTSGTSRGGRGSGRGGRFGGRGYGRTSGQYNSESNRRGSNGFGGE